MKYFLACILFLLSCSSTAKEPVHAPAYGLDFKFIQNKTMTCDFLEVFENQDTIMISFLWGTPGSNYECFVKLLHDPRPKIILVHLSNGVCRFKGNCPDDEPFLSEIPVVAHVVSSMVNEWCDNCTLILSPQLEDRLSDLEACEVAKEIRTYTNAALARNPVTINYLGDSAECFEYIELHNTQRENFPEGKNCIYSNDGYDLEVGNTIWTLPDTVTRDELAEQFDGLPNCLNFVWTADGNCLATDTRLAPYPAERQCALDPATLVELKDIFTGGL